MITNPAAALFVILAIAFLSPIAAQLVHRWRVPGLVFEIALGIIAGPAILNFVTLSAPVELFANLGLASLIFLAGLELDPTRISGRPIRLAMVGWGISIALGLLFAFALSQFGVIKTELFVAFALTTTALGTLLPILRDTGLGSTRLGTHVLAIGSVGEFGPILAVALVLSGASPSRSVASLAIFVVVAIIGLLVTRRVRSERLVRFFHSTLRTSGQLHTRLAVLLVAGMTLLAGELGLDFLLGAFTAGILFRIFLNVSTDEHDRNAVETKIEAISYGYLIPVFFVVTGMTFDLDSLISSPAALLKLPLFLVLFFVVRGVPMLLYRRAVPKRSDRVGLACLSATALPLVVAICAIGVATRQMYPSTATALIGAGMCSIVLGPLLGLRLLGTDDETGKGPGNATATGNTGHAVRTEVAE
ncbi:MAG: cation:proton antiporter [Acidimicrobiia bacterium]